MKNAWTIKVERRWAVVGQPIEGDEGMVFDTPEAARQYAKQTAEDYRQGGCKVRGDARHGYFIEDYEIDSMADDETERQIRKFTPPAFSS
jgi:hypothetical protein